MIDVTDIRRQPLLLIYSRVVALAKRFGFGRLRAVVWLHEKIVSRLLPRIVRYRGCLFETHPRNACGPAFAESHCLEVVFLLARIQPGDVVVDVGANIGLLTVLMAERVGPTGHVYALEPEARNVEILRRNLARNSLANVTVIPKAASDTSGCRTLHLSKTHAELHRMHPSRLCENTVEVESTTLDELLHAEDRPIAWVKIDVEGHELQVLRGMRTIIERNPQIQLFMEFCPRWLDEGCTGAVNLLDSLARMGFILNDVEASRHNEATKRELIQRYTISNYGATNLWCVRNRLEYSVHATTRKAIKETGDRLSTDDRGRAIAHRACNLFRSKERQPHSESADEQTT